MFGYYNIDTQQGINNLKEVLRIMVKNSPSQKA